MKPSAAWRPREMPTLLVNRLGRMLSRPVDAHLNAVGITVSQLPVLVALKGGAALTQKALADACEVEQPSMAQLLSRMERDGLIERTASLTDKRSSLVALTERAKARLEPGRAALRQVDEEVCAVLTPQERQTLAALLNKLIEHVAADDAKK